MFFFSWVINVGDIMLIMIFEQSLLLKEIINMMNFVCYVSVMVK